MFENPDYQKWEHQKYYILDVLKHNQTLLNNNIAMTDLKPANTLYDKGLRKAKIIDLGGCVKVHDLSKFNIKKYYFQKTNIYAAPELNY